MLDWFIDLYLFMLQVNIDTGAKISIYVLAYVEFSIYLVA